MSKEKIVVSRRWNEPEIELFVSQVEVGARMGLQPFIDAVLEELGSPTMIMTRAQLAKKVDAAITSVVDEMKRQTVNIV